MYVCPCTYIDMFDLDRSGSINMYEFGSLFKYINDWKGLFERIDRDRSGYIEEVELRQGKPNLKQAGYTKPNLYIVQQSGNTQSSGTGLHWQYSGV